MDAHLEVISFIYFFFFSGPLELQRYAHEILDHACSTIEVKANGVVIITPHPRNLPSELLLLILQHVEDQADLYACSLVNKQFHAIINPMLWHTPKILHRKALRLFMNCLADARHPTAGRHVQKLNIQGEFWTDTKLSLLLPHIRHLKTIDIQDTARLSHTSFNHVPRHCPELSQVMLRDLKFLAEPTLLQLSQYCTTHLRTLYIQTCPRVSESTFASLIRQCPNMQQFYITFLDFETCTLSFIRRLTSWKQLIALKLGNIPPECANLLLTLTPTRQQAMTQSTPTTASTSTSITPHPYQGYWPHLRRLILSNTSEVTDAMLVPFVQSHPRLTHLQFSDLVATSQFTDESLDTIAAHLPLLQTLILSINPFITSQALRRLVCRCRQLKYLTMYQSLPLINLTDFPEYSNFSGGIITLDHKGLETIRRSSPTTPTTTASSRQ